MKIGTDEMADVKVSPEWGLVVRREALFKRGIALSELLEAMEVDEPLDADEFLLSFGPSFGGEAADEFERRLNKLGFEYYDDYFVFLCAVPRWLEFRVTLKE